MSTPVPHWMIEEGGCYWAAWGDKGWSAVVVTAVRRTKADVMRIDPKTGACKPCNGSVRLDEMVQRDPAKLGSDKPLQSPGVIFATVRLMRDQEKQS